MTSDFNESGNKLRLAKHLNKTLQSPSLTSSNKKNLFFLPPIDIDTKRKAFMQPTSLLTKYVQEKTKNLLRSTKIALRSPIKARMLTIPNTMKSQKRNKSIDKKLLNHKIFITDSNINNNNDSKIHQLIDLNASKNNKYGSSKEITFNNIDSLSSLTLDHGVKEGHLNVLMNKFRRIRTYQPVISENWKFNNGLRVTIGKQKMNALPIKDDVEYQFKIINDEFKLLEDNYTYYKSKVITNDDFYRSFRTMPLISKINYNKMLEESIGILYILPQLLLLEFYKLIKNYSSVNIPNPELFKEKYVFDEVQNLNYNNSLLIKVYEFFKACYDVYSTLIKEVNDATKSNNNAVDTIRKAWEVMHSMDNFPMVADFKKERYNANRQTLGNLYDKTLPLGHLGFGISSLGITPKTYSILSLKTDEEYWKACKSIADYQHYLELYKPAAHAEEAQEKIRRFTEDADNIAWAGAKEKDDVQSYRNYLKRYPQGIHANEARKKLAEIGEMLFGQCKSLADYKEYARLFPDGEHITDVAVRISALEKSQKKDSIEKGICIWLLVAFAFTIALTVLSMFVANQVLVGWITGSVFAYIISLVIYVGIKSQEPQEKQKLTSQNYRSDDFALWYGIIAFLIIEIPTFLICYAIWHKDDEGTWIIASLGVSVTLWVMRFYVLLYLWIKELLGDLHLKIIKNREKAK